MSILIIDDSIDSRVLLQWILTNAGYSDVRIAESAHEAFQMLGLEDPLQDTAAATDIELILMDVLMPDIDGVEACRRIKADERFHDVPIIMVSVLTEIESLSAAFAAGAVDYVTKPLHKVELLARVSSILRLKREMDARKERERELLVIKDQLEQANSRLQQLTLLDGLTGISNRRHFDEVLNREVRRARRDGAWSSLAMVDIDFFKPYNDALGHLVGDDVLKRVAQSLSGALRRAGDLVARYGGEEFAVILPGMNPEGAAFVAERLRASVEAMEIRHPNSPIGKYITISLGIASTGPDNHALPEDLVAAADASLYQAKQEGRNRVRCFGVVLADPPDTADSV